MIDIKIDYYDPYRVRYSALSELKSIPIYLNPSNEETKFLIRNTCNNIVGNIKIRSSITLTNTYYYAIKMHGLIPADEDYKSLVPSIQTPPSLVQDESCAIRHGEAMVLYVKLGDENKLHQTIDKERFQIIVSAKKMYYDESNLRCHFNGIVDKYYSLINLKDNSASGTIADPLKGTQKSIFRHPRIGQIDGQTECSRGYFTLKNQHIEFSNEYDSISKISFITKVRIASQEKMCFVSWTNNPLSYVNFGVNKDGYLYLEFCSGSSTTITGKEFICYTNEVSVFGFSIEKADDKPKIIMTYNGMSLTFAIPDTDFDVGLDCEAYRFCNTTRESSAQFYGEIEEILLYHEFIDIQTHQFIADQLLSE